MNREPVTPQSLRPGTRWLGATVALSLLLHLVLFGALARLVRRVGPQEVYIPIANVITEEPPTARPTGPPKPATRGMKPVARHRAPGKSH